MSKTRSFRPSQSFRIKWKPLGPPQQLYSLSSSRRLRGGTPAKQDGGRVPLRARVWLIVVVVVVFVRVITYPRWCTCPVRNCDALSPPICWVADRGIWGGTRGRRAVNTTFSRVFLVSKTRCCVVVGHYRLSTTFRRSAGTRRLTALSLQSRIFAARTCSGSRTKVLVRP